MATLLRNITAPEMNRRIIYKTLCGSCKAVYHEEAARSFDRRKYKHRNDLHPNRTINSLFLPDSGDASILHSGLNRRQSRSVKSEYIRTRKITNHKEDFVTPTSGTALMLLSAMKEK